MAFRSGGKSGLGWLILIAALAVPGFLFYNWWSRTKTEHEQALAGKARSRLPEGSIFQIAPASAKLLNPISASSAPAAGLPVSSATAAVPAADSDASEAPAPPEVPADLAAASTTTVVLARDPMLSPLDIVRMRERELAKERARLEIEEDNKRRREVATVRKKVESPVENHVELQGTVDTPEGSSLAIVNGATLSAGETFAVAGYRMKVRVVKISASNVTFEYKNRRFTKKVNPE